MRTAVKWRACNEDRVPCANWLAGFFGRSRGALVCSGSMALELALLHLGIEPSWSVVVSSSSCPQVPAAVLRCGATPIILDTSQDLVLTPDAMKQLDNTPQAVIAVHQWGLPCPLGGLRELFGEQVGIIEDAAQSWAMHSNSLENERAADIVVTSMGTGKTLCIDGGGAAFADTRIDTCIDTWSDGQRFRQQPALAVSISKYALPHMISAVRKAETRTEEVRKRVPKLLEQLTDLGLEPWIPKSGLLPSWFFVPIRARGRNEFERLRYGSEASALGVCAPAHPPLEEIPMLKNRTIFIRRATTKTYWILLDPLRALADQGLVERWAKRARV